MKIGAEGWWKLPAFVLGAMLSVSLEMSAQKTETTRSATMKDSTGKPEVFTSGFFDILNSGQVNASARLIRLYVGEKGKFSFPLSIFSGVSSNNFQQQQNNSRTNDQLINNFINPLAGIVNVSIENIAYTDTGITKAGLIYSIGERMLTGMKLVPSGQASTGKPFNFLNSYVVAGIYFQTGAWERTNTSNLGIFWAAGRWIMCKSNPKQLKEIIASIKNNGFYHGYSIGAGIEINSVVNMKVVFYKYIKPPELEYGLPIYQFSFNYYLK